MTSEVYVARDIAEAATAIFMDQKPRTVILAGGRTPQAFYERLATEEYDWPGLDVFFSDERCVPPDHPESNYRMAYEALLSKVRAREHRMRGETCAAEPYEFEMRSVFGGAVPDVDVAFLGLGADGHTASLFPGDPALEERERLVANVKGPDYERLTLTLPVLSGAKLAVFLVAGSAKREAMAAVLAGEDLPATRVKARHVVYLVDPPAAPSS
jgi:6-phosphogluconolactonase